jgi:hypothetical protein
MAQRNNRFRRIVNRTNGRDAHFRVFEGQDVRLKKAER